MPAKRKAPELILGAHTIDNGGIHMAARRAGNAGMTAMQLFTAIPKYYNEKISMKPERVERFRAALATTGIAPANVLVHAPYVLSVATPDPEKFARASAGLAKELQRSTLLGAGAVCFHPGSAADSDRGDSAARIAAAMVRALREVDGATRLLVENTAGAGRTMGKTADEVGAILSHIPAELRVRAGYGLDTCHLFASGHDIAASRESFTSVIDAFESATGEPPAFFHLNDSANPLGSNKDRHMLLGEGAIGVEPFGWLLRDPRARGIPLILETPQDNYEVAEDDDSPDPADLRMVQLLKSLAA